MYFVFWQMCEGEFGLSKSVIFKCSSFWTEMGFVFYVKDKHKTGWQSNSRLISLGNYIILDYNWLAHAYSLLLHSARNIVRIEQYSGVKIKDSDKAQQGVLPARMLEEIWPEEVVAQDLKEVVLMVLEEMELIHFVSVKKQKVLVFDKQRDAPECLPSAVRQKATSREERRRRRRSESDGMEAVYLRRRLEMKLVGRPGKELGRKNDTNVQEKPEKEIKHISQERSHSGVKRELKLTTFLGKLYKDWRKEKKKDKEKGKEKEHQKDYKDIKNGSDKEERVNMNKKMAKSTSSSHFEKKSAKVNKVQERRKGETQNKKMRKKDERALEEKDIIQRMRSNTPEEATQKSEHLFRMLSNNESGVHRERQEKPQISETRKTFDIGREKRQFYRTESVRRKKTREEEIQDQDFEDEGSNPKNERTEWEGKCVNEEEEERQERRLKLVEMKRLHFRTVYRNTASIEKDLNQVAIHFLAISIHCTLFINTLLS